jgi:hypothetical protein
VTREALLLYIADMLVPRAATPARIAKAINVAKRPYSTAVAPASSFMNLMILRMQVFTLTLLNRGPGRASPDILSIGSQAGASRRGLMPLFSPPHGKTIFPGKVGAEALHPLYLSAVSCTTLIWLHPE